MIVEKYTDKKGKMWVRIKFLDYFKTEVIMPETEFTKRYGNISQYMV